MFVQKLAVQKLHVIGSKANQRMTVDEARKTVAMWRISAAYNFQYPARMVETKDLSSLLLDGWSYFAEVKL